ncbi:molybdate transport system ATP-binding protein [Chitinivorax tropicus]|uniref:Molybdate transport system ATP-binding protein n=1 Tax=Chitinivorax tropicus TaxID=714531 RepID=A0A840MJN1_9PROT|nr:ABC transporter ATP-binding protein [Chitinivorax tropicus]MBB5019404.1 molybdate transport system ATP-binding protein [Chitinivorax tropicus]
MIELSLQRRMRSPHGALELSLEGVIQPGECLAIFGPSGAGKTTLLRMLAGLIQPDAGRLVVDGEVWFDATRRIHLPPQRRSIGYVFQDYALFPNMTVQDNLTFAGATPQAAMQLLAMVGLQALADRPPDTLSGGQRQRVAVARALARRPKLLLLDEALAALDRTTRHQLQLDLITWQRTLGITTLLVSHDLAEVIKMANRVWHIQQGRIVAQGPPQTVLLGPKTQGKFNLPADVLAIRQEDVVQVVTLLVGQDVIDVIGDGDELADLQPGDQVTVSIKAFSPILIKNRSTSAC